MGIETIAVYSDVDIRQPFVSQADRALRLGGPAAAESYLNIDRLLEIAIEQEVEAIHPGYGFLAESAEFARRCTRAGLIFVGPDALCIEQMGAKDQARIIAERAGIPIVPGYQGSQQEDQHLLSEARKIGFPVLLKAANGGGGKGLRPVLAADEFLPALAAVKQEAQAAFGDAGIIVEKLIRRPRHIEVQIAADQHGNCLHLFERECSVQRRYQKLIEEAPAAFLSAQQKSALYGDAVKVATAIGYNSLGTVEFILDQSTGQHYFLEMNTRLQVEHCVTEEITGLDLVELQLRVAMGEELGLKQQELKPNGWAIEARVNAEDPARDFMPCTGDLQFYREPENLRVDSGVSQGSSVSPWYDSLLAKVIVTGSDRAEAVRALRQALGEFVIEGVATNRVFLQSLLGKEAFLQQPLHTGFIDACFADGWQAPSPPLAAQIAAVAWQIHRLETRSIDSSPWNSLGNWRMLEQSGWPGKTRVSISQGDWQEAFFVLGRGPNFSVLVEGKPIKVQVLSLSDDSLQIALDEETLNFRYLYQEPRLVLTGLGKTKRTWAFQLQAGHTLATALSDNSTASGAIVSPMPGLITGLSAEVGLSVKKGDLLITMEAMKLVHNLNAPRAGEVLSIGVGVGDSVTGGQVLLQLGPAAEADAV